MIEIINRWKAFIWKNLIYCKLEFRKIVHAKVESKQKGRLVSLDGVSVLNSVGREPSTTRAAFYRSPPPSPFSVTSPPFSLILFATACPIDCYRTRRQRERSRTNPSLFFQSQLIITKISTHCINFTVFLRMGQSRLDIRNVWIWIRYFVIQNLKPKSFLV